MPIYTHTGDEGSSLLPGADPSGRVPKHHPLLAALGDVDELNAVIGLALAEAARTGHQRIEAALTGVQHILLNVGSTLAAVCTGRAPAAAVPAGAVEQMEGEIDALSAGLPANNPDQLMAGLPELAGFILPGGTELTARLHLARTVCRRAERAVVAALHGSTAIGTTAVSAVSSSITAPRRVLPGTPVAPAAAVLRYVNRLSDLLFVLARLANHDAPYGDVPWRKK